MVIKTHKVSSSNVERAGFDEKTNTMEVEFKNGNRYQYNGVPKSVYEGVFKSDSFGSALNKWVIKAGYKFKKLKK